MHNTIKTVNSSNIRLISHYIPDSPAVSLNIFVHTGSRFESDTDSGIAHFFEHMVFKGTPDRPTSYQISYELESIGADVNAATGQEYTVYYVKVLKQHVKKAFEILSDAFLNSSILDSEVDKEREVIKEEIKMYEDDPSSFADDKLLEELYPVDKYGRNIAGSIKNIDSIDSVKIKNFVKKNYFCENTVIVSAGSLEHKDLEDLVLNYFGNYAHGTDKDDAFLEGEFEEPQNYYVKDIQQAQMRLSTYTVPYTDKNKYKYEVALDVLGAGMGSKLFIEVRENRGLAYSIYSYSKHWSKSGYIVIGAGLMQDKIELVNNICLEEIKKLSLGLFTKEDLDRAKELSKSSILMNMDTLDSWAWYLGRQECIYKNITTIDEIISGIDGVTMQDISDVMKELYDKNWHTTVIRGK